MCPCHPNRLAQAAYVFLLMTHFACQPKPGGEQAAHNDARAGAPTAPSDSLRYPDTRHDSGVVDTFYGETVADPYRWLENDTAAETARWVEAQNALSFDYLGRIPYRDSVQQRLAALKNYTRYSTPFRAGAFTYYYRNSGLQDQAVVYREGPGLDSPEVFLDPNTFSDDGTTALAGLEFSSEGDRCAYLISEDGSDWRSAIVLDPATGRQIGDTLRDLKFTGIAWRGNEGFYYSCYPRAQDGGRLTARNRHHRLYYHRLGTPQSEDVLVFGGDRQRLYVGARVSEDQRFLLISAANTTTGNELYLQDLRRRGAPIVPVVDNAEHEHGLVTTDGEFLYLYTTRAAPNGKLVKAPVDAPGPDNWQTVIAERAFPLRPSAAGGYLFAHYLEDAASRVYQYTMGGDSLREVSLPGVGTAYGFSAKAGADTLYYSFSNYVRPSTIYAYVLETGESTVYKAPEPPFDPALFVSRQVFYRSKDSTRIPMTLVHRRELPRNGQRPTWLYGYGGFGISLTPNFGSDAIFWLEQGGILAIPNLRGGGEYGEEWHRAGIKQKKQNVFEDFIAAAEYLFAEDYTRAERLALNGGSNGGLLVGAVMAQRPDLARVAVPQVGVLDMLRYHRFTAGAGWAYDYGTPEESEAMFRYLLDYSPYHNLREGIAYPATLVMTGDHDDRVAPAHSFKFAARLQHCHAGDAPVLIRIATDTGHGAGKPLSMALRESADKYAFALWQMGFRTLPASAEKE